MFLPQRFPGAPPLEKETPNSRKDSNAPRVMQSRFRHDKSVRVLGDSHARVAGEGSRSRRRMPAPPPSCGAAVTCTRWPAHPTPEDVRVRGAERAEARLSALCSDLQKTGACGVGLRVRGLRDSVVFSSTPSPCLTPMSPPGPKLGVSVPHAPINRVGAWARVSAASQASQASCRCTRHARRITHPVAAHSGEQLVVAQVTGVALQVVDGAAVLLLDHGRELEASSTIGQRRHLGVSRTLPHRYHLIIRVGVEWALARNANPMRGDARRARVDACRWRIQLRVVTRSEL
jgi:hypothetical protein